jgi:hypothetical protein
VLLAALLPLSLLFQGAVRAADASIDSTKPVAVSSWGVNRLDVFARGTDGTLRHKVFNGRWSAWESLGGAITSGPAAVSRANGIINVFARGTTGDVQTKSYTNGTWSAWSSLGGGIVGEPTVSSWASNRLDVFVRGTNNALYQRYWNGSAWSGAWGNLGGTISSSPSAVSWGANRIDIFARAGSANSLYHKWFSGSWSGWQDLGGGLTAAPAATSGGSGTLAVYVRGGSNGLHEKTYGSGGWSDFKSLGGTLTSAPAAESWAGGRFDVFAFTTGGGLLQRTLQGSTWGAFTAVPDSGPLVPVTPYTPTVAIQTTPVAGATTSPLAYSYVDNIGRVVSGVQSDPANFGSVQWTVISGNEGFSGPPALIEQSDGRIQISGQHLSGDVWARAQTAKGASTWTPWVNQGGTVASALTVARQTDGTPVLLALDAAGGLWYLKQPNVSGPYQVWTSLGVTGVTGLPAAVAVRDGLQLFAVNASGAMSTARLAPSGTVSAWTSLGGSGLNGTPAVVVYPGYRLRVFARAGDGSVVTKAQDAALAWPPDWSTVAQPGIALGSPAAVLSPLSGRTEVVVRGAAGAVFSTGETVQGSGEWRDWVPVLQGESAATDPTILSFSNGTSLLWAFMFRTVDQVSRVYTVDTGFSGLSRVDSGAAPAFTAASLPTPPR